MKAVFVKEMEKKEFIRKCSLRLQLNSSERSLQSVTPLHRRFLSMQIPFEHRNLSAVHANNYLLCLIL